MPLVQFIRDWGNLPKLKWNDIMDEFNTIEKFEKNLNKTLVRKLTS
jgi:hypothetical protein